MQEQSVTFPSQNLTLEGLYAPPPPARQQKAPSYVIRIRSMAVRCTTTWSTRRWKRCGNAGLRRCASIFAAAATAREVTAAAKARPRTPWPRSATCAAGRGCRPCQSSWPDTPSAPRPHGAPQAGALEALVLIAAPLQMMNAGAVPAARNILLIGGSQDSFCPAAGLKDLCARLGNKAAFRIIDGADHFFSGYEEDITTALTEMLAAAGG